MKKYILVLSVLSMFFSLNSTTCCEEEKVYPCYLLSKEPVLDGKLRDDPGWENIPGVTGFLKLGSGVLGSKESFFRAGYTKEALFIGMECEEPEIEKVVAKSEDGDVKICNEDSVEIFIFPKDVKNYYQFMINTIGSKLLKLLRSENLTYESLVS